MRVRYLFFLVICSGSFFAFPDDTNGVAVGKGGWSFLHPDALEITEFDDSAKNERVELCTAIRDRLNRYRYPNPAKTQSFCGVGVALTYPGFSEPEWVDLDPRINEGLIAALIHYRGSGLKSYERMEPGDPRNSMYLDRARVFVAEGGKIQLWRAELLSEWGEGVRSIGPQNVMQLRYRLDKGVEEKACPEMPTTGWIGNLFIVTDDLSGPDPRLSKAGKFVLGGSSLVLYKGEPYLISGSRYEVDIGKDLGSGPVFFCQISYSQN